MSYVGLGYVDAPAGWASMSLLDRAIAQLSSADAFSVGGKTFWGGQCDFTTFGADVCKEAHALREGSALSPIDTAVGDLLRWNTCMRVGTLYSQADCDAAKAKAAGISTIQQLVPVASAPAAAAPAPVAASCPASYPVAAIDAYGQLTCKPATAATEPVAAPIPYVSEPATDVFTTAPAAALDWLKQETFVPGWPNWLIAVPVIPLGWFMLKKLGVVR